MKAKVLSLAKDLIRKTPTSQGRNCTLLCLWNAAWASPASPQCKYSAICWKRGKKYVLCLHNQYSWSLGMLELTHSWILKSLSEEIQPTTSWGLILSPWDLTDSSCGTGILPRAGNVANKTLAKQISMDWSLLHLDEIFLDFWGLGFFFLLLFWGLLVFSWSSWNMKKKPEIFKN